MVGSSVSKFREVHEFQTAVRAANTEITPTARGGFESTLVRIDLHRLWLQRGIEGNARVASIVCSADRLVLMFVNNANARVHIGTNELKPGHAWLTRLGQQNYQRTEGATEWATLSLPPAAFTESAAILTGQDIAFPAGNVVPLNEAGYLPLQHLHARATHLAMSMPELLRSPETTRTLEQALIVAMIRSLGQGSVRIDTAAKRRHAVLVTRFAALLESRPRQPLHVLDICAGLGISQWTLRDLCHAHLGMGPTRYLRLRRFHLARRALHLADARLATVTEIAMAQGFLELGRFAVEYGRLFGEAPSVTLRRDPGGRPAHVDSVRAPKLPEFA